MVWGRCPTSFFCMRISSCFSTIDLKNWSFLHWIFLASLFKISLTRGFTSGLSVLPHWPQTVFSAVPHCLITVTSCQALKLGSTSLLTLFFFKISCDSSGSPALRMNFRISLSNSTSISTGMLIGICWIRLIWRVLPCEQYCLLI